MSRQTLGKGVYAWQQQTRRPDGLPVTGILEVVDIMLATGARISEALAISLDGRRPRCSKADLDGQWDRHHNQKHKWPEDSRPSEEFQLTAEVLPAVLHR